MFAKLLATFALALFLVQEPFQFEFAGQTDSSGRAHLTLIANESMPTIDVVIKGDGKTIRKTISGMPAGSRRKITWKQRSQVAEYDLKIRGGDMETDFHFKVVKGVGSSGRVGNLVVLSDRAEIVEGHKVRYRAPSPLSSYEYKVYDTEGNVIAGDFVKQEIPAGGTLTVSWDTPGEVFMIHTKAENDFGGFTEYKLVPWSVEIPHTEINFDTGKSDIKGDQEWKVKEALAVALHELVALQKVNKAVNAAITPKLYIVGYTDTVGSAASNKKLSENRARAIAKYFHEHGFWSEIYYAGMGERGLRVATGDNVDEVRNRRALYLLSVQQPASGGQIPGRWKKLADERQRPPGFELPPLPESYKKMKQKDPDADTSSSFIERDDGGAGGGGDEALEAETSSTGAMGNADEDLQAAGEPSEAAGGPPPVDGKPGATGRGCRTTPPSPGAWVWAMLALGLGRRRRGR